jgi:membrane protein DedA with SNARE-associated domain
MYGVVVLAAAAAAIVGDGAGYMVGRMMSRPAPGFILKPMSRSVDRMLRIQD